MRHTARSLQDAHDIATRLEYDGARGEGHGVDKCESCGESVFAIEGYAYDSTIHFGYCLNPECKFELSEGEADEEALTRRVDREP